MVKTSNKEPSDIQITLITTGLVFLGIVAVAGLILNAVNPNFHLIPSNNRQADQMQNTVEQQQESGLTEQNQETKTPVDKTASPAEKQATESGEQASPSGQQASPSAEEL